MNRIIGVALSLAVAASAPAQAPRDIAIDVIVTDRRGEPITGLKQEDFQVFVNRHPQTLTTFSATEHRRAPARGAGLAPISAEHPAPIVPGAVAPIASGGLAPIAPGGLAPIRAESLAPVAGEAEGMKRHVMIYLDDAEPPKALLQQMRDFASSVLRPGDEAMLVTHGRGLTVRVPWTHDLAAIRWTLDALEREPGAGEACTDASSIRTLIDVLAARPGKKILIVLTEGLAVKPDASPVDDVVKTANSSGITVYSIRTGENPPTDAVKTLTYRTGGLDLANDFTGAFQRIQSDLDAYYTLGWRSQAEPTDRHRSVIVKVRNQEYIVRTRHSHVEKSLQAAMNDRVDANLFYSTSSNDLGILTKVGRPLAGQDGFRVPVEIRIPIPNLAYVPEGEEYVGRFEVYAAVANDAQMTPAVVQETKTVRLPRAEMTRDLDRHVTHTVELLVRPGTNTVSIGVLDVLSAVEGFAREQVVVGEPR